MENIHATCIALNNRGILLTGASGSGKSDLALRMILEKGAVLIADDRTDIRRGQPAGCLLSRNNQRIVGSAGRRDCHPSGTS